MNIQDKIHHYIQNHKDEIIYELKELVKIPSVRGEAVPGAPFGKACAEVLEYTQRLYQKKTVLKPSLIKMADICFRIMVKVIKVLVYLHMLMLYL